MKGYVIGKKTCNKDETKDYWSIDFTYGTSNPEVGDTVTLNGVTYTNVLKIDELSDQLKQAGLSVSIDYNSISATEIITTGCNVANPPTYPIKKVTIIAQFEFR